jgi:hypothetical protein
MLQYCTIKYALTLRSRKFIQVAFKKLSSYLIDHLCGLVVRVPGYRSRGPGFDPQRYQIFWEVVGLERGPLSLVRIIEELLERKATAEV